ncbi:MAG: hypothetical protein KGZ73_05210 [Rhizobiales bacterium]|nr:hypothetical protein [Hyphomicrobiales bacterium]
MRKILSIGPKQFLTGIAPDSYAQNKGLWLAAIGINPFITPNLGSGKIGLLQSAPTPVDMTGSTVVDVPWAWESDLTGATTKIYVWGDAGHLYEIDLVTNIVTDKASGAAVSNPAAGIFLVRHSDGTKKLYYFQLTQLGQWQTDQAWSTRANNYYTTDIQSTKHHGVHSMFDRHFFCNGRYIGAAYDDGSGGLTVESTALDLEPSWRATCISDDGTYLVGGITRTTGDVTFAGGQSKLIFWDRNQSSWQREWLIPDATILAIKPLARGLMQAITPTQSYVFSFDLPPEPIEPPLTQGTDTPSASYPAQYAADRLNGASLWGGSARVMSYGKIVPQAPNALHVPFSGFTGSVTMVCSSVHTSNIFIGTSQPKLYRVSTLGAATSESASASTVFVDLERWWQIGRVVIEFADPLESGDSVLVQLTPDNGSQVTFGTPSYTTHGAIRSKELYASVAASHVQITLALSGIIKIKSIELWGDALSVPN